MKHLGFIGLGAMGAPMARALINADFQLQLFDPVAERIRPLLELGSSQAASPKEASEDTDVIVVMVANASQAEDALFGESGASFGLVQGGTILLMSTVGPEAVRNFARRGAEQGLRIMDAPVSGGVRRAETGELLIMAGGERDLFDELRPILDVMGSTVVHCGDDPGDGQSVKLVNQLLCGAHIAVAGEALAYASSLGLDQRFVFETIRHGAANSFMLEDRGERMLTEEFTPAKSALDIFVKDLGLVLEEARQRGYDAPLASTAQELFARGASLGFGTEDDSGIVRVFGR
jgi:3-hydroxyisobutyrate dehydrogenase